MMTFLNRPPTIRNTAKPSLMSLGLERRTDCSRNALARTIGPAIRCGKKLM